MNGKLLVSSDKIALEVLVGIAGNIALGVSSAVFTYTTAGFYASILGLHAGSISGSALGVYLAGNKGNARGQFGMALLGSFLGEIASLAISLSMQSNSNTSEFEQLITFLPMAILPPIVATIMFNRSLRYKSTIEGNGLLNLSKGKLELGVPDINISALPAYGKNMKPEFQFKINMLSVVL